MKNNQKRRIYTVKQPPLHKKPPPTASSTLNLSVTRRALHRLRALRGASIRNILAAKARQHTRIRARQRARRTVRVRLARVAKILLARRGAGRGIEQFTTKTSLLRLNDVLENISLGKDLRARVGLEGVLAVGVEVVVYGVQERVACDLGRAAGGVVDVVLLEGHEVVGTGQVDAPVVVAVAGGGPAGCAVDVAVGDCDAVRGGVAENDVLAGNEVCGYVVDPDEVGCVGC
jgi:hypothetical protein